MRSTSPIQSEFSLPAVFLGGLVGGISHTFLDGIMHPDVRPFMPFSNHNPFLGLIGVGALHVACLVAAVFGAVGVTLWRARGAEERGSQAAGTER